MQCEYCFNEFIQKRKWQRFCSSNCRLANWAVKKVQNAIRKGITKELAEAPNESIQVTPKG